MQKNVEVWVRDNQGDQAWIPGTILENRGESILVEVASDFSNEPLVFKTNTGESELEDVKLANDPEQNTVDDLIQLPHLHEAAILHSLTLRFDEGTIYTFTANAILLAVNPFRSLPLYTEETLQEYFNQGYMRRQGIEPGVPLGPHVYAIADSAYRAMMRGIHASRGGGGVGAGGGDGVSITNQSILISGESGAGKTESTKYVMKYLTTVGSGDSSAATENETEKAETDNSIMMRVMESNPILEAFGNARTIRNDNSSRFGKFIELLFDKRGRLLGASIETYLLEKVRLPNQSENERNFHIFYQMTKGANDEQRKRWGISAPDEHRYTSQGDCYDLRNVEDEDQFEEMLTAMEVMGFSQEDRDSALDITAAVLHLGELEFTMNDEDKAMLVDNHAMDHVLTLAHLTKERLENALTTKTIEVRGEKTTVLLKDYQANDAKDALAKALYGSLFDFIVRSINVHIACQKKHVKASVGVLDIFGFEVFKHNSFEQLCINYTNETLQQQFNQFVFKMEQKEYKREGIEWSFIEFPDNQDCLDLIESRPLGLLAMLDDECRMGVRGSDRNYALRLYKTHENTHRFVFDDHYKAAQTFGVRHYAGQVVYSVVTFLEKNKDDLPKETDELFMSSSSPFVAGLFKEDKKKKKAAAAATSPKRGGGGGAGGAGGLANRKPTVANGFKEQLHALMEVIAKTRPHYIRCIKPNDNAAPNEVNRVRVMEQLRCGGVLEAVRVARSGFPVRMPHIDFYGRYRLLLALETSVSAKTFPVHMRNKSKEVAKQKTEELVSRVLCPAIAKQKDIPSNTIQFGKTKVFLRKNAHDTLEMLRSDSLTTAVLSLQRYGRGYVYRRVFVARMHAVRLIQRMSRGLLGRKKAIGVRRERAAGLLQRVTRCYLCWLRFNVAKSGAVRLQSRFRGWQARETVAEMRRDRAVGMLQRWGRGTPAKRQFARLRRAVLALQCAHRVAGAKGQLKKLKAEARDVGNLKEVNEKLKEEMKTLREQAVQKAAEAGRQEAERAKKEADMARAEAEAVREEMKRLQETQEKQQQDSSGEASETQHALDAALASVDLLKGRNVDLEARVEELEQELERALMDTESAQREASIAREEAAAAATAAAAAAAAGGSALAPPAPPSTERERQSSAAGRADLSGKVAAEKKLREEAEEREVKSNAALKQVKTALAKAEDRADKAEKERQTAEEMIVLMGNRTAKAKARGGSGSVSLASTQPTGENEESGGEKRGEGGEGDNGGATGGGAFSSEEQTMKEQGVGAQPILHTQSEEADLGLGLANDDIMIQKLLDSLQEEKTSRRTLEDEMEELRQELTILRKAASSPKMHGSSTSSLSVRQQRSSSANGTGNSDGMRLPERDDPTDMLASTFGTFGSTGGAGGGSTRNRPRRSLLSPGVSPRSFAASGDFSGSLNSSMNVLRRQNSVEVPEKTQQQISSHLDARINGGVESSANKQHTSQMAHLEPMQEFEERIRHIKQQLTEGVETRLWEGTTQNSHTTLKLSTRESGPNAKPGQQTLCFQSVKSSMIWRSSVAEPLPLTEGVTVQLGHDGKYGLRASTKDEQFLTLGTSSPKGRTIVLQLCKGDKALRNELVSGLRKLISQAEMGVASVSVTRSSELFLPSVAIGHGGGGGDSTRALSPLSPLSPGGAPGEVTVSSTPGHEAMEKKIVVLEEENRRLVEERAHILEELVRMGENHGLVQVRELELRNACNDKDDLVRAMAKENQALKDDITELRRVQKDNQALSMQIFTKMEALEFDNDELKQENRLMKQRYKMAVNADSAMGSMPTSPSSPSVSGLSGFSPEPSPSRGFGASREKPSSTGSDKGDDD